MIYKISSAILTIICWPGMILFAQNQDEGNNLDVLSYHVEIEPNIAQKSIKGNVLIKFNIPENANQIEFNCGSLEVIKIEGSSFKSFNQVNKRLIVNLSNTKNGEHKLQIFYNGNPKRGMIFNSESNQLYTVFFTEEWMICNSQPNDRASIQMDIIAPDSLSVICNGKLKTKKSLGNKKTLHFWVHKASAPAYTYGLTMGPFNSTSTKLDSTLLSYYSSKYSVEELEIIFKNTADMMTFFEEKSGIPYFEVSYSQVLIGSHYQEMSSLSVLKDSYGELVLKDSTETNLITHELAHQWWGNMITCENWNHFWLNEAFATFMSAAYNERRFGREKYMENIDAYRLVYEKIKANGTDKSLVFDDWSNPSRDDHNIVYFKGAYVLHLLREELGDVVFWNGIKSYSRQYFGKSVFTDDFQKSMEKTAQRSLNDFFEQWVY